MISHNNMVILQGNLGTAPELRYTGEDVPVANFVLATDEHYNDSNGERKERTEWHRITVWGRCAELCSEFLEKGQEVHIVGKLQTKKWRDRDGVEHLTTEVHTTNVQFGRKPMRKE